MKIFGSTETINKNEVITNEIAFTNKHIPMRSPTEVSIGVVGDASLTHRHFIQHQALGFQPNNTIIVENSSEMYKNLKKYWSLKDIKNELLLTDIFNPLLPDGVRNTITHVDADITTGIDMKAFTSQIRNIEKAYPNVKSIVLVHSFRKGKTRSDAVLEEFKDFDLLFEYIRIINKRKGNSKENSSQTIDKFKSLYEKVYFGKMSGRQLFLNTLVKELNNYSIYVQSYTGKGSNETDKRGSSMVSFTLCKSNKPTLTIESNYFDTSIATRNEKNYINTLKNDLSLFPYSNNTSSDPFDKIFLQYSKTVNEMHQWAFKG